MPSYFERDWASDTLGFLFGGTPVWPTGGIVISFSDPSATLTAKVNQALSLIASKVDVHFGIGIVSDISVHNGVMANSNIHGITAHDGGSAASAADIYIKASQSGNLGLVLHELGHALGLGHTSDSSSLALTLMSSAYTSAQLATRTTFGDWDWALLNRQFGSAVGNTQDWHGTPYADTLYGGTGIDDPNDGSESIFGYAGKDTLYGNAGDDLIFGGSGVTDPAADADTIYGGLGNDTMYGNGGNDYCSGADGNDIFYGGVGMDTFLGGPGADIFYGQAGDIFQDINAAQGDQFILA